MNQTIYFRKPVWDKFEKEKDKSKLVNELLEKHYGGVVEKKFTTLVPASAVMGTIVSSSKPINKAGKDYSLCPHGNVKGFCKKGCK